MKTSRKFKVTQTEYTHLMRILEICMKARDIPFVTSPKHELERDLPHIDEYIDIISDMLLTNGLKTDSEPTAFGYQLERAIDYLLRMRCENEIK